MAVGGLEALKEACQGGKKAIGTASNTEHDVNPKVLEVLKFQIKTPAVNMIL